MDFSLDTTKLQAFSQLEFIARQVVEGFITGLHKSPFHGFSVEFAEHRLYNSGESIKNIDWKLYGRTDRLYVKRYEEETNLRCQIVIDASSSMYYPVKEKPSLEDLNKITFSVYAAAALMALLKSQRDAVGLTVFTDKIEVATQSKSNAVHHKFLYRQLEQLLQPIPTTDQRRTSAAPLLHEIADNIHKRSLVILFSDMMDTDGKTSDLFPALQHLRHNKHEVILFHVLDKQKEVAFDFDNRPYRFVDMETGQEVKVQASEVKDAYTGAIQSFIQELHLRCGQYKIDLVEADINLGFRQILLPYLLKRERLY